MINWARQIVRLRRMPANLLRYDHMVLGILAVFIGLIVAYGAIGFRISIQNIHETAFGATAEAMTAGTGSVPWWRVMLVPVAGGFVIAGLLRLLTTRNHVSSVADVIEAAALKDGRITLHDGLSSALISAVSLGAGASTGREGPVVHLGAAMASFIARKLRLAPAIARTLLGCGVAGAVAASFNAPIAGVFFALEVIMGHYALHAFAPIVISSVVATIVSRAHLGDFPAFTLPEYAIASVWEFPAFLLLGVISALVAVAFIRSASFIWDKTERLPVPAWTLPPFGGVALGIGAIFLPHILGVGYEATDSALKEMYPLGLLLLLIVAKIAATSVSIGCRFGGGVFSPSLFLGAMTGGAFGLIAASLFPGFASNHGLYAIIGMGAVSAAVLGAPISTILIVFELTGDYSITIAVMIAAAVASLISSLLYKPSFFAYQLEQRGITLEGGRAAHLIRATTVRAVIDRDFVTIKRNETLANIKMRLLAQFGGKLLVTNDAGSLVGVITYSEISATGNDPGLDHLVLAEDICRKDPVMMEESDSLAAALTLMEQSGEDHLPVVNDRQNRIVVGVLHHRDILKTYNQALIDAQTESHGSKI